jgi:DNA-binding NarL/FixJ family response regulator
LKLSNPTIVLADDNFAMREQAASFLRSQFDVVAAVANGSLAVQAVVDLQPDIVVLDIAMPVMGGIEAARQIKRTGLATRIVFLSIQRDPDYIDAAVEMGASYVLKSQMKSDLLIAISAALAGREFISLFQEMNFLA